MQKLKINIRLTPDNKVTNELLINGKLVAFLNSPADEDVDHPHTITNTVITAEDLTDLFELGYELGKAHGNYEIDVNDYTDED